MTYRIMLAALVLVPAYYLYAGGLSQFGTEQWTCAKLARAPSHQVGWVPRGLGIKLFVKRDRSVQFFSLSCVPTGPNTCEYGDEGWESVEVEVYGLATRWRMVFNATTVDIDSRYIHHATAKGERALALIAAFRFGQTATIKVAGPGERSYTQTVGLSDFAQALQECEVRWRSAPNSG